MSDFQLEVRIEGVPVTGMIDTGSEISIISGELFKTIIDTAQLRSETLKPADRRACAYNEQLISLDGQMDVTIAFESLNYICKA